MASPSNVGSNSNGLLSITDPDIVYNSYSGVDIVAVMVLPNEAPLIIGELQTISYSMHRDNTPVRTIGNVNPIGFVKGSRTLAGSLIFTNFDEYFFYKLKMFQYALADNIYPVADMLPPFDVVLTFANEYGLASKMRIYGITIVDEGGTFSIDDLITESVFTYMARGMTPMISQATDANRFPAAQVAAIRPATVTASASLRLA